MSGHGRSDTRRSGSKTPSAPKASPDTTRREGFRRSGKEKSLRRRQAREEQKTERVFSVAEAAEQTRHGGLFDTACAKNRSSKLFRKKVWEGQEMTYRQIKEQIRKLGYLNERDFAFEFGDTLREDVNDVLFELASDAAPIRRRIAVERVSSDGRTEFDIGQLLGKDFMRFDETPPRNADTGTSVEGWQFETDTVVRLPKSAVGKFFIGYIKNPATVEAEDELDFEPDISEAAQRLIALGVAARIYADDEPELAEGYARKFGELKNSLKRGADVTDAWENTTGWL